MEVPFTQYLRPDGRQVQVSIDVEDEIGEKAKKIIDQGLKFECEMLMTGQVSLTITDLNQGDLACMVVNNGPPVQEAVKRMILDFNL